MPLLEQNAPVPLLWLVGDLERRGEQFTEMSKSNKSRNAYIYIVIDHICRHSIYCILYCMNDI